MKKLINKWILLFILLIIILVIFFTKKGEEINYITNTLLTVIQAYK